MVAVKTVSVFVRAIQPGFSLGRRRVGAEFDYPARVGEDGKPVLPSWVVLVSEPAPVKTLEPVPEEKTLLTFKEGADDIGADLF